MLSPGRAVVIDCKTTDLTGAVCEIAVVDTCGQILLSTLINPFCADRSGCHTDAQHHRRDGRQSESLSRRP